MTATLAAFNALVDKVLAYRPTTKSRKPKKATKTTRRKPLARKKP
jgi:hypothetical protein